MYSKKFKLEVGKEAYERVGTFKELAEKYHVAIPTIQLWKNIYAEENNLPKNFYDPDVIKSSNRKIQKLEDEVLKLKIENERLKKGYIVKGVGRQKEYISIVKRNTK